ncbi:MAG: hypothetical protein ACOYMG_06035 [Candidatus Methylumidiphilus sp.]
MMTFALTPLCANVVANHCPPRWLANLIGEKMKKKNTVETDQGVLRRIELMVELYAYAHMGKKAMFSCSNIHHANYGEKHFNKVMIRLCGKGALGHAISRENSLSNEVVEDFVHSDHVHAVFATIDDEWVFPGVITFDCVRGFIFPPTTE